MTPELLAAAQDRQVSIASYWDGFVRRWTVKDSDGVFLFSTDSYANLLRRLNEGTGLRVGDYPPKWWPH